MKIWSLSLGIAITVMLAGLLPGCSGNNVSPQRMGGNRVTLHTEDQNATRIAPAWVAFQDGDGAWTPLTPTATGTYTASVINEARTYGIAVESTTTGNNQLQIMHGTTAELSTVDLQQWIDPGTTNTITLSGTVSGVPTGGFFFIGMGNKHTYQRWNGLPGQTSYTLNASPGVSDLFGELYNSSSDTKPAKLLLFRNVNLTGNTTQNFDFSSADTMTLSQTYTVTQTNDPATNGMTVSLTTSNGAFLLLGGGFGGATGLSVSYAALPVNALAPGEVYDADVYNANATGDGAVSIDHYFHTAADQTITLPAQIAAPTVNDNPVGGSLFPTMTWANDPGTQMYFVHYGQYTQSPNTETMVYLTSGWLAHHGTNSYTVPNFSGIPGWLSAWNLSPSAQINPSILACATNSALQNFYDDSTTGTWDGLTRSFSNVSLQNRGRIAGPNFQRPPFLPLH